MNDSLSNRKFTEQYSLDLNTKVFAILGLSYIDDFISEREEIELIKIIYNQNWLNDLKRRVQHYGWKYDYRVKTINRNMSLGPLPEWLYRIAFRLWQSGITEEIPDQVIINEYKPGQGIANHIDCEPCFGSTVISLSLASTCVMNFTNKISMIKTDIILARRSLLCMKGEARYMWSHGIIPRLADDIAGVRTNRQTRISMTFRKVII